jgi:hypothetical protein
MNARQQQAAPQKKTLMRLDDPVPQGGPEDALDDPRALSPKSEAARLAHNPQGARMMPQAARDDDLLEGILGKDAQKPAQRKPPQAAPAEEHHDGDGGLNEIQKMLGLK